MPLNWGLSHLRAARIRAAVRNQGLDGSGSNLPILYLPGILGAKLYDRRERVAVWGDYRGLLFRKDHHAPYAYDARDTERILATETLHAFTIVPGLLHTLVTAELIHVLETALGYQEGRDLFFVGHDWRGDCRHLVARLNHEVERIQALFGAQQRFLIIGQSIANLAIRFWLRTARPEIRSSVAKWYAFGPPWKGTFHALSMMQTGYYPASSAFHGFSPDDVASYPSAYQLMPSAPRVIDSRGQLLSDFSLFDPACWERYRLGPYRHSGAESAQREKNRADLPAHLHTAQALAESLSGPCATEVKIPQLWFLGDRNQAVKAAVYDGDSLVLQAGAIRKRFPHLVDAALTPGDDHLPLADLLVDPCGPVVRDIHNQPHGESYVLVGAAKTHRALINYTPNLATLALDIATLRKGLSC